MLSSFYYICIMKDSKQPIGSLGEFGLIDHIRGEFSSVEDFPSLAEIPVQIGDDCAVLPQESGFHSVVSTDMLVEGSHFLRERITPYQLGWKSAAVNFSDIAAMGASPAGSFLALALPRDISADWVKEFIRGYKDISKLYAFPLLGGDTTSSPGGISICVTVIGRCEKGRERLRSGAKAGDLVCVSGTLGDSGLGLDSILNGREDEALVKAHYLPHPRFDLAKLLAGDDSVHAMMDLSDGLASDLLHIMEESHCGAQVDLDAIPISEHARVYCAKYGLDPLRPALCAGEDYQLLFTADAASFNAAAYADVTVIGRITAEQQTASIQWKKAPASFDTEALKGFRHF